MPSSLHMLSHWGWNTLVDLVRLVEEQISEEEKMTNFARDMAEVEDSVAKAGEYLQPLLEATLCPVFGKKMLMKCVPKFGG